MKRVLLEKPEPLLLVIPLLLLLLNKVFFSDAAPGIQQLNDNLLFWMVFAFIVVPFQLHFLLRASRKWEPAFCRTHVYITISLLLLFFLTFYSATQPLPQSFFDASPGTVKVVDSFMPDKKVAGILVIEMILQCLFVVYFLIRIFQKK